MPQPIPNKIKNERPELSVKSFNTLLIDGSNILKLSVSGNRKLSSNGREVGGIFEFLLQIKIMLKKANFRYVYVFWDDERSGELRHNLLSDYKENRDKTFDESNLSPYMREVNERIRNMQRKFRKKQTVVEDEKANFYWQRDVIIECLEELCIRQCMCDITEADDFIGYYVSHKKPEERIVIMSNDRDLTQLISDDVIVYIQAKHQFVNTKNHREIMGYSHENVLLKKVICGDASDNIKGIKGVGEKTLFTYFPEFLDRKVYLCDVIEGAKRINEERAKNKKKPLKWADNIVNKVTDGVQGDKIYEINNRVIDLKDPLMTEEAKELLSSLMYAPMDMDGRSLSNLYKILCEAGVDDLKDENRFANFFLEFKYFANVEKKN